MNISCASSNEEQVNVIYVFIFTYFSIVFYSISFLTSVVGHKLFHVLTVPKRVSCIFTHTCIETKGIGRIPICQETRKVYTNHRFSFPTCKSTVHYSLQFFAPYKIHIYEVYRVTKPHHFILLSVSITIVIRINSIVIISYPLF